MERARSSPEAQRLLKAQRSHLTNILRSIETVGPAKYRKSDHWAWYVWPTTKVGYSDPKETACVDAHDIEYVLACEETRATWTSILDSLTACLHAQQRKSFLPSIDHGRIDYFVKEWVDDMHAPLVAAYPQFQSALQGFVQAWQGASGSRPGWTRPIGQLSAPAPARKPVPDAARAPQNTGGVERTASNGPLAQAFARGQNRAGEGPPPARRAATN